MAKQLVKKRWRWRRKPNSKQLLNFYFADKEETTIFIVMHQRLLLTLKNILPADSPVHILCSSSAWVPTNSLLRLHCNVTYHWLIENSRSRVIKKQMSIARDMEHK
jgi:hypothetical protein